MVQQTNQWLKHTMQPIDSSTRVTWRLCVLRDLESHVQSSAANRYVLAMSCHKKQRYVEARAQAIMKLLLLHPLALKLLLAYVHLTVVLNCICLLFTFSSADHDRCADYSIAYGCVSMLTTLNCFWKAPIVTPNGVDFSLLFLSRLIIVRLVFPTCKMHQPWL